MVVYDQSTRDVTGLAADSFLSILLGKLDSCFHSVSILTGRSPGLPLHPALVPLVWSNGAVATCVHLHPLSQPLVAAVAEDSPTCGPRRLDPRWHRWVIPVHSFLSPSSFPLLHPPARVNERGGYGGVAVTWIQPPKRCPLFSHPCAASSPVNVPRARPGSGALLSLAAVKGRAGEEIRGCAGKEKGKEGRGRGSSLGESGSAGDDVLWARVCRQEEAHAALMTALLQSKMGDSQPMNERLQPSREEEKEAASC